jgi:PTS system ascorbate-specific IIB component
LKPKIIAVCGFGVGSSLMLKMKVDEMLKKNGITVSAETSDVGSASSVPCDVIFTSKELAPKLAEKVKVPVIAISNFLDTKEIEEKGLAVVQGLLKK